MASETQENFRGRSRRSGFERLDKLCERGILGIVLAILAWGPVAYGAVWVGRDVPEVSHLYGLLVIQGLVVLALGLWAVRCFTQRPFRLLWPPVCWAVLAFLVYAFVRCPLVTVEYAARKELIETVLYAALFFVIVNNLNRRESANAVTAALIAVGLGESLFALYQYITHNPTIWEVSKPAYYALRGSGTYVNPDDFAGFVEMIIPLALAYTVMGRLSATMKVLAGYSTLVMIVGVVVSQSRGGVLAMAASLVMLCVVLMSQREYWRRGAVIMAGLLLFGLVLLLQFGAVMGRFETGSDRPFFWYVAIQIFRQHMLWGAGPEHYQYYYPRYLTYTGNYGEMVPRNAHNDYLTTLCEWGLVGFAIIIVALGALYAGVWRTWPYVKRTSNEMDRKNSSKAAFVLGAALGLFAIIIHSVVDFNMHIPANAITAVTLMAMLAAHERFGTEGYWINPGRIGKVLLATAAVGVAAYLAAAGVRSGREFYWFNQGYAGKGSWDQQLSDFKKAYEIESHNYLTPYYLGERHLAKALQGDSDYKYQTAEAMKWYEQAMALNPYDPGAPLSYGICLDWLDRHQEATHYFLLANELGPYNAAVSLNYGRHCMEMNNYSLAEFWFDRCLVAGFGGNAREYQDLAKEYLKIDRERMANAAKGIPMP